ncbi:MAG TPA: polysaccharide deacetylase family protein [Micromonosporaceae bacterium]|nr:polysaccharide deacetylase family protein [Micromonosporaceae bacterium]
MTAVAVLGYHSIGDAPRDGTLRWSVSPGDFDEQMALLRQRGCTPLTVSGYAELLRLGGPMPPKPVLVTFDDGFPDLATAALPILRRYGITATAYVITSRVGAGTRPGKDPSLDWDQLADLRGNGVEIGSHSHTHRALDCLRRAELHEEVTISKRVLEDGLRQRVHTFAYPYGYHSPAVRHTVRAAGYTSACAVKNALSHPGDDPFAVARVLVERGTGAAGIDTILAGAGWPLAWPGERLRTRGWRAYRRARHAWQHVVRRSARTPRTGGDAP